MEVNIQGENYYWILLQPWITILVSQFNFGLITWATISININFVDDDDANVNIAIKGFHETTQLEVSKNVKWVIRSVRKGRKQSLW